MDEYIPLAYTYRESLEIAKNHGIFKMVKNKALCVVIVLKDGSEHIFRGDTGMYLSSKLKERCQ